MIIKRKVTRNTCTNLRQSMHACDTVSNLLCVHVIMQEQLLCILTDELQGQHSCIDAAQENYMLGMILLNLKFDFCKELTK